MERQELVSVCVTGVWGVAQDRVRRCEWDTSG